jgi:hypothetical protein
VSNNRATDIGELQTILHSRIFFEVLGEHKDFLQGEVNRFIKAQDMTNAYASLKAMEDAGKIVELLRKKMADLQK